MYTKESEAGTCTDICIPTFIAALFTVAKSWRQPECPPMKERINKMWSIHTMEHYSAFKRRKYAPTWMTLEDIKLNEVSQSQDDRYYVILLI